MFVFCCTGEEIPFIVMINLGLSPPVIYYLWSKWLKRWDYLILGNSSGPCFVAVSGQELSSPGLPLSCVVCWGVSNQGRQAADGMKMLNWHGVVGTRKQTAAIFILLVFFSFFFSSPHRPSFLMNKSRRGEVEQQPGSCNWRNEKRRRRRG